MAKYEKDGFNNYTGYCTYKTEQNVYLKMLTKKIKKDVKIKKNFRLKKNPADICLEILSK